MGFQTETAPWLLSDSDRSRAREAMSETARHAKALGTIAARQSRLVDSHTALRLQKI